MIRFGAKVAAVASLAAAVTTAAHAVVLYDNGPVNGEITSLPEINLELAVSDSFTLSAASTITSIDFGVWLQPGDTLETVDWAIATAPGVFPDGPAAAVTTGAPTLNAYGFEVSADSFSTGAVALGPGAYYLVLQGAVDTDLADDYAVLWDEDDGPSTETDNYDVPTGSESFQILGTTSGVPEASAWAMMLAGFGMIGTALRRRTRAFASA